MIFKKINNNSRIFFILFSYPVLLGFSYFYIYRIIMVFWQVDFDK